MAKGIILSSSSHGATQELIEDTLAKNGLEVEKEESAAAKTEVTEEPKRDDFDTEEEFEAAHVDWQDAKDEPVEKGKAKTKAADEDEEGEEEERPAAKRPSRVQRKIERATRELKQQNEDLQKRLEALEKGEKAPAKKEETKNSRPERSKFKDDQEYEDALLAWGVDKALADKAAKDAEKTRRQTLENNLSNYRTQVEEFSETHDDWDEVVDQDLPMHTGVQLAIMEQDNGAEVVYYLGKHPEYAKKLAEKSELSAIMEVGRLSERLKTGASREKGAADGGTKQKTRQRSPEPPEPVSTAATSSTGLTSKEIAAKPNYPGKMRDFKRALREGR
jgi:hypothetical protein